MRQNPSIGLAVAAGGINIDKVTGHVRGACRKESTDSAFADTQNIPTLNRARSTQHCRVSVFVHANYRGRLRANIDCERKRLHGVTAKIIATIERLERLLFFT